MTPAQIRAGFGYSRGDTATEPTGALPAGVEGYAITSPRRSALRAITAAQPTPPKPPRPNVPPSPLTPPHGPCHQPRSLHLLMRAVA